MTTYICQDHDCQQKVLESQVVWLHLGMKDVPKCPHCRGRLVFEDSIKKETD